VGWDWKGGVVCEGEAVAFEREKMGMAMKAIENERRKGPRGRTVP